MSSRETSDPRGPAADLSIGDLAERTGVASATLRMWESRHGFPEAHRLPSGHRRYDEGHVAQVLDVVSKREAGVRLDAAIAQVAADDAPTAQAGVRAPGAPSVFASLRRQHPHLVPYQLTKRTLLSLSWAIEDEFCARAEKAPAFGAFQREQYFDAARERWADVARASSTTYALADFAQGGPLPGSERLCRVPLPEDHPMLREWAVVCDSPSLPVVLTAWELPGQQRVPDSQRIFESIWTIDAAAVHDAARVSAQVCADLGAPGADDLVAELAEPAHPERADLAGAAILFNRIVSYLDSGRGRAARA